MALTKKQLAFVNEFLVDLNLTKAAIRAGYSPRTARAQGSRLLLTNVDIQKELQRLQKERSERIKVDAEYVFQRLVDIDQMDISDIMNTNGTLKPIHEWPPIWRQSVSAFDVQEVYDGRGEKRGVSGIIKKIKLPDKLKNLELLGRHIDIQCWKEKHEHEVGTDAQQVLRDIVKAIDGTSKGLPSAALQSSTAACSAGMN